MRLERDGDAEEVPRETLNAGTDDRNYGFNSPHLLRSTENITAEVVDEQQSDEQVADASTSLASPSLLEISEARNAQLQTELDAVLAALQERNMNLRDLRDRHEGACIELDTLKRFIAAEDERDAERSMAAELHDDGQEMSEDCITATAKASIASAQSAEPRNSTASSSLVDDGDAAVPSALNTDPSFGLSVSSVASSVREERSSSSSSSSGGTRMERSKLLLALVHLEDSVKLQKRTTGETEARLRRAQTTVHGVRRQLRRANDRIEDMEKGNANVLRPLKARIEALVAELAAGNAENAKAVARAIDASEARKAAEKLAEEATTAAAEAARKQKCAEEAASELEADLAALEESAAEEVEMRVKKGCHALTRDLDEAHDRQQELNTELKAALKSLKEEKAAHKEVQEELSGTQSRLQGAVDESDRLKAAAEAQRALVEQLEAAAEAHEINITAVRQSALDREERIASLEGFVEKGATRVTELTRKQLEMRTHQDHLSRILQMKHVEIAALEVKAQKDARAMKVAAEAAAADAEAAVQAREALKIQHQHSIAALQARRNVWKERAIASRAQVRRLRVEYDVGEEEYDAADDREEEEWEEDDEDDNDGDDDSIDAASATSSLNNGTKNTIITNTAAGAGRRVGISTLRSGTRGATTVPARVSVQVGVAVQCTDLLGSTDEALEALRLAETLRSLARSSLATAEGERAQASGEEGSSGLVEMLHSLLLHAHGGTSKVPAAAESLRLQHLDHNQPNGPQLRAHTPLSGWPGVNERALPEGGHRSRRGESQGETRTETEEVGKATPRGMMQHQQQQLGKKEKGTVGARIALEGNQQKQRRAKGKSELKEIGQGRAMRSKMKCQKQGRQRRRRRRRRKGKADSSSDDDDDDDDDDEEEEIGDHGGQTKHGVNGMGPESPDPNMSVDRSTVLRYDGVDEGDDGEEQGGEDESVVTPVPVTTGSDARSKAVQEKLHAAEARERSWKSSFIGSPGDMHHQFAPHHDQRGEGSNDDCDDDSKSSTPAIDEHGFLEGGAADILLHNVFLAEAGGARKRAELRKKLGEQQRHPIDFRESMGGVSPVSTPSISGAAFSLTTPLPSPYQHQSALGSTVNPPGSSMLIKEDRFAKRHGVGAVDLHSAYLPKIDPARTSGKTNVFSFPNYDDDDDDHDHDKGNRPRGTDTNRRTKNRESRDISYFNNGEQASSSAPPTPESMGRSLLIASAGL